MTDGASRNDSDGRNRFALLSSPARSAIATIWIAGEQAAQLIGDTFASVTDKSVAEFGIGNVHFGHWSEEGVVLCRIEADQFELHCHGGIAAQNAIADQLRSLGLQQVAWETLDEERSANLIQAEANKALRSAKTERVAAILLEQHNGALLRAINACLVLINRSEAAKSIELIDQLLADSSIGLHLVEPFKIVVAGRPNVGKSSVINRLLGYERAIVFDQPGTTRDVVKSQTAFNGWPAELSDTAGLRNSDDVIESAGVDRATREVQNADLVITVFDWSAAWTQSDQELLNHRDEGIVVFNKTDLPGSSSGEEQTPSPLEANGRAIRVSAISGAGISKLVELIGDTIVPAAPATDAPVPFTERQIALLRSARELIMSANFPGARLELKQIVATRT